MIKPQTLKQCLNMLKIPIPEARSLSGSELREPLPERGDSSFHGPSTKTFLKEYLFPLAYMLVVRR